MDTLPQKSDFQYDNGGDYLKSGPDKIAISKAESAAIVWGYHEDNASIGNPVLLYGTNLVGQSIKQLHSPMPQ